MRSDAPFRDAKAKLLEIRLKQSKRDGRRDGGTDKRKKKKLKVSSENKWNKCKKYASTAADK